MSTVTQDELWDELVRQLQLSHSLTPEELTPDAALGSLGVDSLAAACILIDVEEALGIELNPAALKNLDPNSTLGALAAALGNSASA